MGRDVAGQAWIAVFPPGPADPVRLFIDGEMLARLMQADGRQQACHARSDDSEMQPLAVLAVAVPMVRHLTLLIRGDASIMSAEMTPRTIQMD